MAGDWMTGVATVSNNAIYGRPNEYARGNDLLWDLRRLDPHGPQLDRARAVNVQAAILAGYIGIDRHDKLTINRDGKRAYRRERRKRQMR